jgi:threonine/homoserine/homoserine lactone efflux protein
MNLPTFSLGILALLILPGPTNAVLAMMSPGLTVKRLTSLLLAVVSAYLLVILPVSGIAGPFLHAHPAIAQAVRLISAVWVLFLALKLWRSQSEGAAAPVGIRELFLTTLLNPKAIIIGLTIVPAVEAPLPLTILIFVASVTVTSTLWIVLGRLIIGRGTAMPLLAQRCASAVLMFFSVTLVISAVG